MRSLASSGNASSPSSPVAEDQAETFLIRLSRATGIVGLAGMQPAWQLTADHGDEHAAAAAGAANSIDGASHVFAAQQASTDGGGGGGGKGSSRQANSIRVLRPLLGVGRSQLRGLLKRCGVAWVDDPTNADTSYSRNAIRSLISQQHTQQQVPLPDTSVGQDEGSPRLRSPPAGADNEKGSASQAVPDVLQLPAVDPAAPAVLSDILRLQRRCAATTTEMQRQSAALLAACAPPYLQLGRAPGAIALALPPLLAAPRTPAVHVLTAVLEVGFACGLCQLLSPSAWQMPFVHPQSLKHNYSRSVQALITQGESLVC